MRKLLVNTYKDNVLAQLSGQDPSADAASKRIVLRIRYAALYRASS